MEGLPNDLLREILSRVPYRSLCRLKCVSPAWLVLCSDPAVRKRSPQTLSGFFGDSPDGITRFINMSGRGWPLVDPSLPFLRGFENVRLLDCCGGILLCHGMRAWRAEYIVCNPATEEIWAALPVPRSHHNPPESYVRDHTISLCFDPAVPSRFTVFVIIDNDHGITAIEVYSSDAREWASMSSGWGHQTRIGSPSLQIFWDDWRSCESGYFFLDGTLYFIAYYDSGYNIFDSEGSTMNLIVTGDTDGSTWRTIQQPPKVKFIFIGHSQGRLHGMQIDHDIGCRLSVWVLENYASGQWTLKHTANEV
uniref:F-box domain-containing protein n=1 Tax=Triticum urartu TaxID=4572 RepID=A0A8R7TB14_TRIUA